MTGSLPHKSELESDLAQRAAAAKGISLVTVVIGTPFIIANLVQGYHVLAVTSIAATLLLVAHALAIRDSPGAVKYTTLLIIPAGLVCLAAAVHCRGTLGLLWTYPVIIGFYCLLERRLAWGANIAVVITVVPYVLLNSELELALRTVTTILTVSAFTAVLMNVIHHDRRFLVQRMVTDPLTGVLNRQTFTEHLDAAARSGTTTTLLAIDIDNFKQINDEGGHAVGDKALQLLGSSLTSWVRNDDAVFRTGGDEFVVILESVTADEAFGPAESLRQAVQRDASACGLQISVSGGLATLHPGECVDSWVIAADRALYKAKSAGRGRLVMAPAQSGLDSADAALTAGLPAATAATIS